MAYLDEVIDQLSDDLVTAGYTQATELFTLDLLGTVADKKFTFGSVSLTGNTLMDYSADFNDETPAVFDLLIMNETTAGQHFTNLKTVVGTRYEEIRKLIEKDFSVTLDGFGNLAVANASVVPKFDNNAWLIVLHLQIAVDIAWEM